jgi:hypothetical protein
MLLFAIIVVIVACLLIYAIDQVPMSPPLPVILKVIILVGAALVIAQRGGLL